MTDFAVTGKKRSGKGLFCVGLIRDALFRGQRVATNMDIYLDQLMPPTFRGTIIRLPDCPTVADMEALGRGYEGDSIKEDFNGLIILDEASKYFNSRTFGDKERQPLLDWLIHSGKKRWDVYYQMQGLVQVDKQLRETQVEYHVSVKRMDRWPIPFVTPLAKLIGLNIRFPKMHLGLYQQGTDRQAFVVDRKFYRAKDLYRAYDTEQVFLDRDHPSACGLHTVLSPWHTKGRYIAKVPPRWLRHIYHTFNVRWWEKPSATATKPARPGKHPLAVALSKLPEAEAVRHFNRLAALGYWDRVTP